MTSTGWLVLAHMLVRFVYRVTQPLHMLIQQAWIQGAEKRKKMQIGALHSNTPEVLAIRLQLNKKIEDNGGPALYGVR